MNIACLTINPLNNNHSHRRSRIKLKNTEQFAKLLNCLKIKSNLQQLK